MRQLQLFEELNIRRVVNVASVPKRSPFRYPGGKTWLVPEIRQWLSSRPKPPALLIEPFAGGAIVGLTAAFERLAEHVVLVELDPEVAAVWKTILGEGATWLADRILNFDLSPESALAVVEAACETTEEMAFRTILRNRISHGGILAPGGGMLKNGENGKGIASRWYPVTLAKRIHEIAARRHMLTILEADGIETVREMGQDQRNVFFIDPPYTAAGKRAGRRLYTYCELDHEALFTACEQVSGDFLMTYDNAEEVRNMATAHGFDTDLAPMKNTHHAEMYELLIGRNLAWFR